MDPVVSLRRERRPPLPKLLRAGAFLAAVASGCAPSRTSTPPDLAPAAHDSGAPEPGPVGRPYLAVARMTFEAQLGVLDGRAVDIPWDGAVFPSAVVLRFGDADWDPLDPYGGASCLVVAPFGWPSHALDERGVLATAWAVDPARATTTCGAWELPPGLDPLSWVTRHPDWVFGVTPDLTPSQLAALAADGVSPERAATMTGGWWHVPILEPGERDVPSDGTLLFTFDPGGSALPAPRAALVGATALPDAVYLGTPPLVLPLTP
jgi:hypothetical protein